MLGSRHRHSSHERWAGARVRDGSTSALEGVTAGHRGLVATHARWPAIGSAKRSGRTYVRRASAHRTRAPRSSTTIGDNCGRRGGGSTSNPAGTGERTHPGLGGPALATPTAAISAMWTRLAPEGAMPSPPSRSPPTEASPTRAPRVRPRSTRRASSSPRTDVTRCETRQQVAPPCPDR